MVASAVGSLLLFPEAFLMLVLAKTYKVAKAAVVPTVVAATPSWSRRTRSSRSLGARRVRGRIPGGLFVLISPAATVFLAALVFAAASSRRCGSRRPRSPPNRPTTRSVRSCEARRCVGRDRDGQPPGIVGFVTFLLAFALRGGSDVRNGGRSAHLAGAWPTLAIAAI